mmetsp:Transcript_67890/g.196500  ORF Transcript_67890/g.196500 Transcript_67890/m.196500 type:complete len:630 (+) Transcript_67890:137-2026(+)
MCEVPCSCATIFAFVALLSGYLLGRGKQVHVSHKPMVLDEVERWCPDELPPMVSTMTRSAASLYHRFMAYGSDEVDSFALDHHWADEFFSAFFVSAMPLSMQLSRARFAVDVEVPTKVGSTRAFQAGQISVPEADLDDPYHLVYEKFVPRIVRNTLVDPASRCFMRALRRLPFADGLYDADGNAWPAVLHEGKYVRKRDWVEAFYRPYRLMDGAAAHPKRENDLGGLFLKDGSWSDELEKALAFELIGVHRVQLTDKTFDGAQSAFVLPFNSMASAAVREGLGRYGADMYFDANGMPVRIVTPEAREVSPGDGDWQYWKWVWRSTLIGSITLVDHFYLTHLRVANLVSRLTRSSLPPNHFLRRLMSIFTFGSIDANRVFLHSLMGPNHTLHRATPFKDFEVLSGLVPATMPSLLELHANILHDDAFQALPAKLRESPYYADGKLLLDALRNLTNRMLSAHLSESCTSDAVVKDLQLLAFRNLLVAQDAQIGHAATIEAAPKCTDLQDLLLAFIWTLTGWHQHVGATGDYFADPELAGLSWKEGETFARPRQSMLATMLAAFTSLPHPKLDDDFAHLFRGIDKEQQFIKILESFRDELREVHSVVAQRNVQRTVKNFHADPAMVECSAAA